MSLASIFKQTDIFYGLTPDQLERIAALCREKRFNTGDLIFEENSVGDELYIIVQGEVDIQVDPSLVADANTQPTRPVTITTLRRGQSFGEIALVDEGLRSASARCASNNTLLLTISRAGLIGLCDADPQLGYRLMNNLAADLALKIRSTDLRFREELLYGSRHTKKK